MDLDLTDEQLMLRDSLRKMLADMSPIKIVRDMEADPAGYPGPLWQALAEMGILGLNLEEGFGGSGLGAIDLVLVCEELGRVLCPAPHLETAIIAARLIARAGTDEQKQAWLPRIAAGEAVLTPAFLEPDGSMGPKGVQLACEARGDGYRLNGRKFFVSFAAQADRLIVSARRGPEDDDIDLFLVDPEAAGVTLIKTESHALDPRYLVTFENVEVPAGARIGAAGAGWAAWAAIRPEVMMAQAAWFVGCGDKAVELTSAYAKERVQFDRPIGSFQAVAHQLADAATGIAASRLLSWKAAWAKDSGRPFGHLAAIAHLRAAEAARFATRTGHQVFGGIGFTNDIDIQLYARRAKQNMVAWFAPGALEDAIADQIIDGEDA